jgi:rhodanese-related sulfurtransferase
MAAAVSRALGSAIALFLAANGSAAAAAPAAIDPNVMATKLCDSIVSDKGSVSRVLSEFAGVPAGTSREQARELIRKFTAARYRLGRQQSGLYCQAGPVDMGLYRLALEAGNHHAVWELTQYGLDPNVVDPKSGKNALDDAAEFINARTLRDEITVTPAARLDPPVLGGEKKYRRELLGLMRDYELLQEAGGHHSGQAAPRPQSCQATAADKPAPGVPFDGKLSETGSGPTPAQIPGVTTVSARQAACLIDTLGSDLLVAAVLRDKDVVPGSYDFAYASAKGSFDDRIQTVLADDLKIFNGYTRKDQRPVLVYCHHENCRLSYNAVLRMKAAGYKNIYWMREGLEAWLAAGYPTGGLTATHKPLRPFEKY